MCQTVSISCATCSLSLVPSVHDVSFSYFILFKIIIRVITGNQKLVLHHFFPSYMLPLVSLFGVAQNICLSNFQ